MTESAHATVDGIDLTQMLSNLDAMQQKLDGLTPGTVPAADFSTLRAQVSTLADQIKALSATTASGVDHAALVALQAAEAADHQALAGVQTILANLAAVLGGHLDATLPPATGTGNVGATTPPAKPAFTGQSVGSQTDPNVYPLEVPVVANGADILMGTGHNVFELDAASSPQAAADANQISHINIIFVRPDGTMQGVAADIPVTSFEGEGSPKQSIKVRGPWGSNPKFLITGSSKGSGMGGLFIGSANCDLAPLGISGVVNYAGTLITNEPKTYISVSATTLTLMQGINAPSGAAPGTASSTATAVPVAGAFINGAPARTDTLDKLLAAVPAGGTLTLPAGKIVGDGTLSSPNMTVIGQGEGNTTIDATGLHLPMDKAVLLLAAPGSMIKSLSITGGSTTNGNNGAGVRQTGPGIDVNLEDVELYGNQDGLLTFPGNVTLTRVHAHSNGAPGSQRTHDVYIGGAKDSVVNTTGGLFEKCADVHAFKSRAFTNNINGGVFIAGGNGSCLDIPDGGNTIVTSATLRLPPGTAPDLNIVTFGLEDSQAYGVHDLTFQDVAIDDVLSAGLIQGKAGATLTLLGKCTYNGANPPTITGFTVTGAFQKAAG
jgi:hypothetical protein